MRNLGLADLAAPTVLLALVQLILGAKRAANGMEGLGFRLPGWVQARYSPKVAAGLEIVCGALQVAAALLLGGHH